MSQSTSQLPLYPADHRVNQPPSPGSAEAERMTAGSGRNLLASLKAFYRHGSWQRILLESLVLKTGWRSRNGLLVWKLRVTRSSRRLYILLRHSAPTTGDTASSLLPTLRAMDAKGSTYQRDRGQKGKERLTLNGCARLLPTLTARDHRPRGPSELKRQSPGLSAVGTLDPVFCEWYMGFEDGWTDIESEPSATQ